MTSPYGSFDPVPLMKLGIAGFYPHKFIWLEASRVNFETVYTNRGELWGRLGDGKIFLRNYCGVTARDRLQRKGTDTVYKLERVDRGDDELICKIDDQSAGAQ